MENCEGFVNAYNNLKCFGFIRRKKGKDVYFLIDDFRHPIDIDFDLTGKRLRFNIQKTPKGPRAVNIELIRS